MKRASQALLTHLSKKASSPSLAREGKPTSLLEEGSAVSISISVHLKRVPPKQSGSFARPASIGPLPHSLLDPEDGIEVCLFAKDPGDDLRTKLAEVPVAGLTRVLAVGKLKKDYQDFSRRRELVSQFDMFLCDDRVLNFMPQLTGKAFYEKRKAPIPVRVSSNNAAAIAAEIVRARDSTHTLLGAGQTVSLKIGHSLMTADQITENVLYSASRLVDHLPKKWRGVMSMHLLATGTVALPLYKNLPRIEADAADDDDDEEEEEEEEEETGADDDKMTGKETKKAAVTIIAVANKTVKSIPTQQSKPSIAGELKRVVPPVLPASSGPPSKVLSTTATATKASVPVGKSAVVVGAKRSLAAATEGEGGSSNNASSIRASKKSKPSISSSSLSSSSAVTSSSAAATKSATTATVAAATKIPKAAIVPPKSAPVVKDAKAVVPAASSAPSSSSILPKKPSVTKAAAPPPPPPSVVLKRMPPQPEMGVLRTEHKRVAEKIALKKAIKETKGKF